MTVDQAQHLLKLSNAGYRIKWNAGPYVDEFASVWVDDGVPVISSHVYDKETLTAVRVRDIRVYREIEEWDRHEPR